MTDSGLEMPPDQKASQTRSTWDRIGPVSKASPPPSQGVNLYRRGISLGNDGNGARGRRQAWLGSDSCAVESVTARSSCAGADRGVIPRPEVVNLAADLLAPVAGRVGGQREVGV